MKMLKISILAVFLLAGLAACAGKYSGGGWILSDLQDGGKANFGFIADSCDVVWDDGIGTFDGVFNYHDKSLRPAVKMHGDVVWAQECGPFCAIDDCDYIINVDYRSTNPKARGEGSAIVCLFDGGEGSKAVAPDHIGIFVSSGPFEGYYNEGEVKGNIKNHGCN